MSTQPQQALPPYATCAGSLKQNRQIAERLERGPMIASRHGWGLYLCAITYETQVFPAQNAYEVTAKLFGAFEVFGKLERSLSWGWDDGEYTKPDMGRAFHDVRWIQVLEIQGVEWLPTDQYGNRRPSPQINGFLMQVRKRFDIKCDKPMRKSIPIRLWVKERPDGKLQGKLVQWWRRMFPRTGLMKFSSQPITEDMRPDMIALVQLRLEQGR